MKPILTLIGSNSLIHTPKAPMAVMSALAAVSMAHGSDTTMTPSSKHSLVEPAVAASSYDARKSAVWQVSEEIAKSHPDLEISLKNTGSEGHALEFAKSARYVVVIDQLKSDTVSSRPAYAKRAFASIPTHTGFAKVSVFDVSQDKMVGTFEATSVSETSASPLEPTRVMKQALSAAISQFCNPSK